LKFANLDNRKTDKAVRKLLARCKSMGIPS
jgi:hypothetical protein